MTENDPLETPEAANEPLNDIQETERPEVPLAENGEREAAGTDSNEGNETQQIRVFGPQIKPVVTWVLLGISILIYAAQLITKQLYGFDIPLELGAKYGPLIDKYGQWWRLITPIFLHGSITHILFNMYALFAIGPELEKYYGHLDYLLFYLISGFAGNVLSYVISPDSISVGASTSLFGLIAAQGFLVYKNKKLIRNYQHVIRNILMVVGVNLLLGMQSSIDNWGHLGGLLAGAIMAYLSSPVLDIRFEKEKQRFSLYDTVSKKSRYASYAICTAFFISIAFAL